MTAGHRRRAACSAALLPLVLVVGCTTQTVNRSATTSSTRPTRTSVGPNSTTSTLAPTTTAGTARVSVSLRLVECPTSFGVPLATVPLPAKISLTIPADLAPSLAVYTDTREIMKMVGPLGWDCSASYGADGSGGVEVFPADERGASGQAFANPAEAIVGNETSACVACTLLQACQLFPEAASQLHSQFSSEFCPPAPVGQETTQLSATAIGFEDPPGVKGVGVPSGGANAAIGVMTFAFGSHNGSWTETCTLPAVDRPVCTTSVDAFTTWYQNE